MQVWTVQPQEVWKSWQEKGDYSGNPDRVDPDLLPAYQWMIKQMEQRIGPRPHPHAMPVWMWYQYASHRRRKPDLRSCNQLSRGRQGVRLEIEIDDHLVLLSDFTAWHCVLNESYLPGNEEDGEQFYALQEASGLSYDKYCLLPKVHGQIVASWQRIFDLDWKQEKLAVQATCWELHLRQVRKVTDFVAR